MLTVKAAIRGANIMNMSVKIRIIWHCALKQTIKSTRSWFKAGLELVRSWLEAGSELVRSWFEAGSNQIA